VNTTRILLSLALLCGLAACESEPMDTGVDANSIDTVLNEHAADRDQVISSLADARDIELTTSTALDRAAARHALDLADRRMSTHIGRDGSSPRERLSDAGAEIDGVREFIFQIQGEPENLAERALATWLAPFEDNAVLTEPATHAAVAFAPTEDGGYVGVLLLAQR
jgi:uncharacterized protein YkwD